MGQQPRQLDPGSSPAAFFGARVRTLRADAGLSQTELGRLVHVSGALIGKIEKGERRPGHDLVSRLDGVLDTHGELARVASQFQSLPATRGSRRGLADRTWTDGADQLRRLADVYDCPMDGPTRSLVQLQRCVSDVVAMRLASNYSGLLKTVPQLIPELTRALFEHPETEREQVAGLLVQAWRAADAVADKGGLFDLSARLIHIIGWAADASGSELLQAVRHYVRAETFFASGQLAAGRTMLERAADQLVPGASEDAAAQFGALHMRAAVIAAGAGLAEQAADHLAEAWTVARRLNERVWQGTVFGPVSVRIHEVSTAVELNDPHTVLAAAAGWVPPTTLPAERRSHFYVDLARAQLAVGRGDAVLEALTSARTIAPEHVRVHPAVRQTLVEVSSISSRHASAARQFAASLTAPR